MNTRWLLLAFVPFTLTNAIAVAPAVDTIRRDLRTPAAPSHDPGLGDLAHALGQVQESLDKVLVDLLRYQNTLDENQQAPDSDKFTKPPPPKVDIAADADDADDQPHPGPMPPSNSFEHHDRIQVGASSPDGPPPAPAPTSPSEDDNTHAPDTASYSNPTTHDDTRTHRNDIHAVPIPADEQNSSDRDPPRSNDGTRLIAPAARPGLPVNDADLSDEDLVAMLRRRARQARAARVPRHANFASGAGADEDPEQSRSNARRRLVSILADDEDDALLQAIAAEGLTSGASSNGMLRRISTQRRPRIALADE